MKTYAYCRVSTQRQSLARQIENVTKVYPDAIIYSDQFSFPRMGFWRVATARSTRR